MKLVIFSDVHAHPFTEFSHLTENGVNSRLRDIINALVEVYEYAREEENEGHEVVMLFAGDMFHAKGKIDTVAHQLVTELTLTFAPCYAIVGNHDQAPVAGFHSLAGLYMRVLAGTESVVRLPELLVAGIGYTADKDYLVSRLVAAKSAAKANNVFRVLMAHTGVDGAFVGPNDVPLKTNVSADDFTEGGVWDLVIVGHYHTPQMIRADRGNGLILIPGSICGHNFGDVSGPHGFWVLDTTKTFPDALGFHQTVSSPEFVDQVVDMNGRVVYPPGWKYRKDTKFYARILRERDDVDYENIEISNCAARRIVRKNKPQEARNRAGINLGMTFSQMLGGFVRALKTEAPEKMAGLDVETVLTVGERILEEVVANG